MSESGSVLKLYDDQPAGVIETITAQAEELAKLIESRVMYTMISGKKYVHVEGWLTVGAMVGVHPVIEWTRPLIANNQLIGYEARCIVVTVDERTIGAGESMVTKHEPNWSDRADHALRSMAQTRAISKALRSVLGFIVAIAGYEGTTAAEIVTLDPTGTAKREVLSLLDGDKEVALERWMAALKALEIGTEETLDDTQGELIVNWVATHIVAEIIPEAEVVTDE